MEDLAKEIKALFQDMEEKEAAADKAEEIYTEDQSEENEANFDACYNAQFVATEKLIKALCKIGSEAKTWRKVLATKRETIRDLCERLAA